jgi:hypothetical protein
MNNKKTNKVFFTGTCRFVYSYLAIKLVKENEPDENP